MTMSSRPDHTLAWMKFDEWISRALEKGATDLYLLPGHKVMCRVNRELQELDPMELDASQTRWVGVCMAEREIDYMQQGYISVVRPINDTHYAEVVFARSGGKVSVTVKFRGGKLPTLEECNVPLAVTRLLIAPNGLIIVAGPHASGKTTTLYVLAQWLNENRALHLCTVEKPRHYLLKPAKSLVQQREVGRDCVSGAAGIDAAMQQDADALVVSEVEDFETLAAVLQAAEKGHLVLVQLHADDPADAVARLLAAAPESMQGQVKRQLAGCLRGIVVQRLAKFADGRTRKAVCDVLGEGARKLVEGGRLDAGAYLARVQDEIGKLESARKITGEEAARLLREVGA